MSGYLSAFTPATASCAAVITPFSFPPLHSVRTSPETSAPNWRYPANAKTT